MAFHNAWSTMDNNPIQSIASIFNLQFNTDSLSMSVIFTCSAWKVTLRKRLAEDWTTCIIVQLMWVCGTYINF